MRKQLSLTICIASLIFGSVSCRDDVAWNASARINPMEWTPRNPAVFVIDPAGYIPAPANKFAEMTSRATGDTIASIRGVFNAVISLRYRDDCNAEKIRLAVETVSLDSPILTDTLEITLFSPSGAPAGSGKMGIHEASVAMPRPLNVGSGTAVSISPIDYKTPIRGVTDATLLLKRP